MSHQFSTAAVTAGFASFVALNPTGWLKKRALCAQKLRSTSEIIPADRQFKVLDYMCRGRWKKNKNGVSPNVNNQAPPSVGSGITDALGFWEDPERDSARNI